VNVNNAASSKDLLIKREADVPVEEENYLAPETVLALKKA
jgi:hypothetical protein